jgi:phage shock protein PspC (stress-responsive transcriptional regulator)
MKKVININFHGRVIPIEETAYDILKQYVESLRRYFANEEGRDEIINDIEGRIAELFSERLKSGATCITDEHVNTIIAGMGRPEDFEAEDADINGAASAGRGSASQQSSSSSYAGSSSSGPTYSTGANRGRGRLYRNADDQILGGVASGLANYLGIDPVVMRIVFVIATPALFWVYILLWIIIPSQSIESNITKRLYRSDEDKIIGGVCGGLAAYFSISTWIPRVIFALPLILGLLSGPFWWNDWDFIWGPKIITGSLSTTLFITYIILWITLPIATTAAEKLEMRGEKVNLNSIRDTVKGDLENFKSKAQNWGEEVKHSAQQFGEKAKEWGQTASSRAKTFSKEAGPAARRAGGGLGHAIGVLFKAFFLFIAAIIVLSLFGVFMGLLFGNYTFFPFTDFMLDGFGQHVLAWSSIILFLGIPLIALITWLIRRIMGVRTRTHYLGYVFGTLWFVGVVCVVLLSGIIIRNFKRRAFTEQDFAMVQPAGNKLLIDVASDKNYRYYGNNWFGFEWDRDAPFYGINDDSVMVNNIRVDILQSNDSAFHVTVVKFSHGRNMEIAKTLSEKINFTVSQHDSMLLLPRGFGISQHDKFRNQQVLIIVKVPIGKRIFLDRSLNNYNWININDNDNRGAYYDEDWDHRYWIERGEEYIMTNDGPKKIEDLDEKELRKGRIVPKKKRNREGEEGESYSNDNDSDNSVQKDTTSRYRYRRNNESKKTDTTSEAKPASTGANSEAFNDESNSGGAVTRHGAEVSSPLSNLLQFLP